MNQYSKFEEEFEQAQDRVGRAPRRAMEWMLKQFVDPTADVAAMDHTRIIQLACEVSVFLRSRWGSIGLPPRGLLVEVGPSQEPYRVIRGQLCPRLLDKAALLTLQCGVRPIIDQYLAEHSMGFPFANGEVFCHTLEDGRPRLKFESSDIPTFLLKTALLLLTVGGGLARCTHQSCGRICMFERRRKNEFCPKCSNLLRARLFRSRHKKRQKKRQKTR